MDVFLVVITAVPIALVIWFVISVIRVWLYERQINKICDVRDKEIERIKKGGETISFVEGSIKVEKEKWQAKLDELERKRRFILDKLPLIKK